MTLREFVWLVLGLIAFGIPLGYLLGRYVEHYRLTGRWNLQEDSWVEQLLALSEDEADAQASGVSTAQSQRERARRYGHLRLVDSDTASVVSLADARKAAARARHPAFSTRPDDGPRSS